MTLSIIIPVYNEKFTIREIIKRVNGINIEKEIIIIDDGSNDGTEKMLENLKKIFDFKLIHHKTNLGKGMAVQTGLNYATGEITIIQDADLEYSPENYLSLINPINKNKTKIVYGSRNLRKNISRSYLRYFWGGKFLSWLTNILYGSHLTDINTGYKVFKTDALKQINLETKGFEFCEEVTAKLLKKGYRIWEIPIEYSPRTFEQGKKIVGWKDGLKAVFTLIKYRFIN